MINYMILYYNKNCPYRQLFHFLQLFHGFEPPKMKQLTVGTVNVQTALSSVNYLALSRAKTFQYIGSYQHMTMYCRIGCRLHCVFNLYCV